MSDQIEVKMTKMNYDKDRPAAENPQRREQSGAIVGLPCDVRAPNADVTCTGKNQTRFTNTSHVNPGNGSSRRPQPAPAG